MNGTRRKIKLSVWSSSLQCTTKVLRTPPSDSTKNRWQGILGTKTNRRLHLPVKVLAQNMFSCDVKSVSFRCQTFKFLRTNVKFHFSILLKGKMILINKKGRNYQKGVPLSTIFSFTSLVSVTGFYTEDEPKTSKFDTWNSDVWRHAKTCFARVP